MRQECSRSSLPLQCENAPSAPVCDPARWRTVHHTRPTCRRATIAAKALGSVILGRRAVTCARQNRQARIFWKSPVRQRKFAAPEDRPSVGFDACRIAAVGAQTRFIPIGLDSVGTRHSLRDSSRIMSEPGNRGQKEELARFCTHAAYKAPPMLEPITKINSNMKSPKTTKKVRPCGVLINSWTCCTLCGS